MLDEEQLVKIYLINFVSPKMGAGIGSVQHMT